MTPGWVHSVLNAPTKGLSQLITAAVAWTDSYASPRLCRPSLQQPSSTGWGKGQEERPGEACSSRVGRQGRASSSDSLLPQNGELTMLGEITHLQGIIDDLVVLTAEPHKLPPASEQVWPALGTGLEGMACLHLGTAEEKRDNIWGRQLRRKDQMCPNTY